MTIAAIIRTTFDERADVIREAETWLGTPYQHGQGLKGAGVDCARLLTAVYEAAGVVPAINPGYYGQNWFLHERKERLVDVIAGYCQQVTTPAIGDIAVFRFGRATSHGAIYLWDGAVIHADRMQKRVVRDRMLAGDFLSRRFAGFWSLKRWHS